MRKFKRAAAIILSAGMIFSLCACGSSDKSEIKTTLKNFESACQELDSDEILDCIDPSVADPIRTGTGLLDTLGVDTDAMIASAAATLFGENYTDSEFLTSLELEVLEIDMEEDSSTATALCTITYELNDEEHSQDAEISLNHTVSDGETGWFISGITLK